MKNAINPNQKHYFVKKGKNHVFGTDFAARKSMSRTAAEELFDKTWEERIKPAIVNGLLVDANNLRLRVPDTNHSYINTGSEHREFNLSGSNWIAQITNDANDQLWIIPNKAYDTRSITATFNTQSQKDEFDRLAAKHGFDPQEYARRVLTACISIHATEE